jgi:hypothetical protein
MLRTGVLIAAMWLSLSGAAGACRVASSHSGIIYEQAPSTENLPADALILDVAFDMNSERRVRGLRFVTARVRRVVHGEFSGDRIEVRVGHSSCSHPFMFGTEGYMVAARLTWDEAQEPFYTALEHQAADHH